MIEASSHHNSMFEKKENGKGVGSSLEMKQCMGWGRQTPPGREVSRVVCIRKGKQATSGCRRPTMALAY